MDMMVILNASGVGVSRPPMTNAIRNAYFRDLVSVRSGRCPCGPGDHDERKLEDRACGKHELEVKSM